MPATDHLVYRIDLVQGPLGSLGLVEGVHHIPVLADPPSDILDGDCQAKAFDVGDSPYRSTRRAVGRGPAGLFAQRCQKAVDRRVKVAGSMCEESYEVPVLCRRCLKRCPVFHRGILCAQRCSKYNFLLARKECECLLCTAQEHSHNVG